MKKSETLTATVALAIGYAASAIFGDMNAEAITRQKTIRKEASKETVSCVLSAVVKEACPDIDGDCLESFKDVRFKGYNEGLWMDARFIIPGKFKAE